MPILSITGTSLLARTESFVVAMRLLVILTPGSTKRYHPLNSLVFKRLLEILM